MSRRNDSGWTLWAITFLGTALLWIKFLWPPVARYLYCHKPPIDSVLYTLLRPRSQIYTNDVYHYGPYMGWVAMVITVCLLVLFLMLSISTIRILRNFRSILTPHENLEVRKRPIRGISKSQPEFNA